MVEVCRGKLVILDGTPGHTVYMYRHFNDKMECFFFWSENHATWVFLSNNIQCDVEEKGRTYMRDEFINSGDKQITSAN